MAHTSLRMCNNFNSLVLACVCGVLFIARVGLIVVFRYERPLGEYEKEGEEKVPL